MMTTTFLMMLFTFFLMAAILIHADVCVSGAATGLLTWFNTVVPSLFPFMVLTGLLIQSKVLTLFSERLQGFPLLKRLPITAIFAVVTGLLCGYPMGIRTVSELKQNGQLTHKQATFLYSFVNQPGPMFILGYALPFSGLSNDKTHLFLIAFYGGIMIVALLAFIFTEFFVHTDSDPITPNSSVKHPAQRSILLLFEEVLMSSMTTLAKIGGYMILFSLLSALFAVFFPEAPLIRLIFSGLLEMTSGIALVSDTVGTAPFLIIGFISFGGFSVTAQSFTLGALRVREQCFYLLWKLIQSIISILLLYFLLIPLR